MRPYYKNAFNFSLRLTSFMMKCWRETLMLAPYAHVY